MAVDTDIMGRQIRHRGECSECHTFRTDGKAPSSHRFYCSQYEDLGVLRVGNYTPQQVKGNGR